MALKKNGTEVPLKTVSKFLHRNSFFFAYLFHMKFFSKYSIFQSPLFIKYQNNILYFHQIISFFLGSYFCLYVHIFNIWFQISGLHDLLIERVQIFDTKKRKIKRCSPQYRILDLFPFISNQELSINRWKSEINILRS